MLMDIEVGPYDKEQPKNEKPKKIKHKDRLIAQMVAGVMWSIATFNLITGGIAGIQADMLKNDIEALENQKLTATPQQVEQISEEINNINSKIKDKEDFLMPSVYSFLASGAVGTSAIIYDELKKKKQENNYENQNTL